MHGNLYLFFVKEQVQSVLEVVLGAFLDLILGQKMLYSGNI